MEELVGAKADAEPVPTAGGALTAAAPPAAVGDALRVGTPSLEGLATICFCGAVAWLGIPELTPYKVNP